VEDILMGITKIEMYTQGLTCEQFQAEAEFSFVSFPYLLISMIPAGFEELVNAIRIPGDCLYKKNR
jgi:hypothetical protein